MIDQHIFIALQEKMVFSLKNTTQVIKGDFSQATLRSLPQLTPQQIRALCKSQQQAILQKVLVARSLDIYDEMAAVCPQSRDIRTLSNDEVDKRIESKMMARRELSDEEEGSISEYSSRQQFFSDDMEMEGMQMIDEQEQIAVSYNSMSNIFQLCENHHIWNPHDILELN